MESRASALVLPPGTVPRIVLSGEELAVELINHSPKDSWATITRYPDGYVRHHQAFSVIDLLRQVTGQLKCRYNLDSFEFLAIPPTLDRPFTIKIGAIKYA